MTGGPSLPLTRTGARVRHRHSRREGRVSPDPCPHGEVRILFDGDSRSRSVPAHAVEYLDASGQPRSRP